MRITIRPYMVDYVNRVASELGIEDVSEVVSIILLDHKRGICGCRTLREAELPTSTETPPKDPNEVLADGLEEFLSSSSY